MQNLSANNLRALLRCVDRETDHLTAWIANQHDLIATLRGKRNAARRAGAQKKLYAIRARREMFLIARDCYARFLREHAYD